MAWVMMYAQLQGRVAQPRYSPHLLYALDPGGLCTGVRATGVSVARSVRSTLLQKCPESLMRQRFRGSRHCVIFL